MKRPVIPPSDADRLAARQLIRASSHASLGTLGKDTTPFVSLTATATDHAGRPLLLLSGLAEHTRNLFADPRVSLLFEDEGAPPNPQTKARVTVQGRAGRTNDAALLKRYLARHPSAEMYAGFADFELWCIEPEAAHFVAGFGRAVTLGPDFLIPKEIAGKLAAEEPALLSGLKVDPATLATQLLKRRGKTWRLAGLDADGLDLRLGMRVKRLAFGAPAESPAAVAERVAELVAQAG